jgi:hypothetical protein
VILSRIDGDATKAGELDDGVMNAGILRGVSVTKLVRQFLNKWKYLSAFFRFDNFLRPVLFVLHPKSFRLKGRTNRANHIQVENSR